MICDYGSGIVALDSKVLKGWSLIGSGDFTAAKKLRVDRVDDGLVLYGGRDADSMAEFSIKLVVLTR